MLNSAAISLRKPKYQSPSPGWIDAGSYVQSLRTTQNKKAPQIVDLRGFYLYGGKIGI